MTGGPFAPSERGGVPADKVRLAPVSKLHGWDRNPRTITPARLKDLARDLEADPGMLWARPLVAREDGTVLMGNQRLAAARALGWTHLPVAFVTVDDEVAVLRAIRDNVPYGAWESQGLAEMLREVPEATRHLAGLDTSALQVALGYGKYPSLDRDEDPIPLVPAAPETKPGDVLELGPHRLVCGDATDPDVWALLMDGVDRESAVVFTSPPYGLGDQMHLRNQAFGPRAEATRVRARPATSAYAASDDDPASWRALMDGWLPSARSHTAAQVVDVQLLAPNKRDLIRWLADNVEYLADVGVWAKTKAPPQMKSRVLSCAFEFLVVLADEGASRTLPFSNFHGTEWNVVTLSSGTMPDDHLATMPVGLASHIVHRWVPRAPVVVDPFAGTGTTMAAVHQDSSRACRMIELDPGYCDVIRRRWEGLADGGA